MEVRIAEERPVELIGRHLGREIERVLILGQVRVVIRLAGRVVVDDVHAIAARPAAEGLRRDPDASRHDAAPARPPLVGEQWISWAMTVR